MIQNINIYPTGDTTWAIQVAREGSPPVTRYGWSDSHPELLADLLELAYSVKSPEELIIEKTFQIVEQTATDEQILELTDVIPQWKLGVDYEKNMVRKYNDKYYRCLQDHKSEINREPDKAVSLWVEIGADEADGDEIINWYTPTSERYFTLGQLMRYTDGKVYESMLAVNVYSPESYPAGWKHREDKE